MQPTTMTTQILAALLFASPAFSGDAANMLATSTLKDWKVLPASEKLRVAQDLAGDVPAQDRRVAVEKITANISECLDHLAADAKYESFALGVAYQECVGPAARDFQ